MPSPSLLTESACSSSLLTGPLAFPSIPNESACSHQAFSRVRLPFQAFSMSPLAPIKPSHKVRLLFKPSLSFFIFLSPLVRLPSQVFSYCPLSLALQAVSLIRLPLQSFSMCPLANQASFTLSLPGLTDLGLSRARVGTVQVIVDGLATGAFPCRQTLTTARCWRAPGVARYPVGCRRPSP